MRIREVWFENYCQHRSRVVQFEDGLTFFTGVNGAGKSNTFRGISGCLSGDFESRTMGGKAKDVSFFIKSGDKSQVSTTWELADGTIFRVTRDLLKTGSAVFAVEGRDPFIGKEQEVTDKVEELIGYSMATIKTCMFVRQGSIGEVFRMTPGQRVDALIGLTNAGVARVLDEALRDYEKRDSIRMEDYKESTLALAENDFAEAQKYRGIRDKHHELKSKLLLPIDAERLRKVVRDREEYLKSRDRARKAKELSLEREQVSNAAEALRNKLAEKHELAEEKYLTHKQKYEELLTAYREADKRNQLRADIEELEKELQESCPKIPKARDEIGLMSLEHIRGQIDKFNKRLSEQESIVKMHEDEACPTCKRPFDISVEDYKKALADIKSIEESLSVMETLEEEYHRHQNEVKDAERAVKSWQQRQQDLKKQLERLGKKPKAVTDLEPPCRKLLDKLRNAAEIAEEERDDAQNAFESAFTEFQKAIAVYSDRIKSHRALTKVEPNDAKQAASKLTRDERRTEEYEEHAQVVQQARDKYLTASRALRAARAERRRVEAIKPVSEVIQKARSVCKALPGRTIAELARQMEPRINDRLADLKVPFTMEVTEDLTFNFTKDGYTFPDSRISGGQACAAGIAFWLAVSEVAGIDAIFLDEPFDGLHSQVEAELPEFLATLDTLCRKQKKQLVIVTHHQDLATIGKRVNL